MGCAAHQRSKDQILTEHDRAESRDPDSSREIERMKDLLPLMPECAKALLAIQAGQVVEVGPL